MSRESALIRKFPGLAHGHFRLASPQDHRYNCIAFAADETGRCWHPSTFRGLFCPDGTPREDTLNGWAASFATLGYRSCESVRPEAGVEKVAIYGTPELPLHMTRQLPDGRWASKLGPREDIEHDLEGLEGDEYGTVLLVLARPAAEAADG